MVRLFEILRSADKRVSTHKQTSEITKSPAVSVTIDKLSFELPSPIPEAELKERFRTTGLKSRLTKLRDRRWYIQVGAPDSGLYFALGSRFSPNTNRLVSRPSSFSGFLEYKKHLQQIFSKNEIDEFRITRLDLAIDYQEDLGSILRGFDFKRKQAQVSYSDKGGQRTGLCVGRGAEKFVVYDKAAEAHLPRPLTRIEIQLSGKKLPARNLQGLQKAIFSGTWNPFDLITLNEVTLLEHTETLVSAQQERLSTLAPILNREGLFAAKRVFNKQGNYARDYQPLMRIEPWQEQPHDTFRKHFFNFFNPNPKEIQNGIHRETETCES